MPNYKYLANLRHASRNSEECLGGVATPASPISAALMLYYLYGQNVIFVATLKYIPIGLKFGMHTFLTNCNSFKPVEEHLEIFLKIPCRGERGCLADGVAWPPPVSDFW